MKKGIMVFIVVIASIALTAGIAKAVATRNITKTLGGTTGDIFDIDGALQVDSLRVGNQGTGGVTYFNGTIINSTTGVGNADNPVTFGDNVRIDGQVYRGATAGTSDTQPFVVNDNMQVIGSLAIGSLSGTGVVTSANITDGTVAAADLADGAVTTTKILDSTIATADLADDSVTPAKINGTGSANLPIAYGYCSSAGAFVGGTSNVACAWDAANTRYLITITGEDYYYNDYITTVTPVGHSYITETSSVSNKLIVEFSTDAGAAGQQTDFAFVVYKF